MFTDETRISLADLAAAGLRLRPIDAVTIARAVDAAVTETGASGPKDMGKVMKVVMTKLTGLTVDGRAVSELVKSRLTG